MKQREIRLSDGKEKEKEKERRRTEGCTSCIKSINKWMSYLRVPEWIEQNPKIEMFRWQMCQRASITRPLGFQEIVTNGALEQHRREQGVRKSFTPILPPCIESLRIPSYDLSSEPNSCPRWSAISPILFALHVVRYVVENHSAIGNARSVPHECSHSFLSATKSLVALHRWSLNAIGWKRRVSVVSLCTGDRTQFDNQEAHRLFIRRFSLTAINGCCSSLVVMWYFYRARRIEHGWIIDRHLPFNRIERDSALFHRVCQTIMREISEEMCKRMANETRGVMTICPINSFNEASGACLASWKRLNFSIRME